MFASLPEMMPAAGVVGLSVAVAGCGVVTGETALGWANGAQKIPATAATVFEAASLGKPVFACIVVRLVQAGMFGLDDELRALAPLGDEAGSLPGLTVRHVLSHTSGLPNWRSPERPFCLYFAPGTRFSYSGEAYALLQRVVEQVSGETLETLAERLVFGPLGMVNSTFDGATALRQTLAVPHDGSGNSLAKKLGRPNAASSLHTTAADYARFVVAVLDDRMSLSSTGWLAPQMAVPARFFEALDPAGKPSVDSAVAWGLGWGLETDGAALFHWGSNPGFKSFVFGSRRDGRALVTLSTGTAELGLGAEMTKFMFGGSRPCLDWFERG